MRDDFGVVPNTDALVVRFDDWRAQCDALRIQWAVTTLPAVGPPPLCDDDAVSRDIANGWGVTNATGKANSPPPA